MRRRQVNGQLAIAVPSHTWMLTWATLGMQGAPQNQTPLTDASRHGGSTRSGVESLRRRGVVFAVRQLHISHI
jgi:hypothetical protein